MTTNNFKLHSYTMVTFILNGETITRYFQGNATFYQINGITGHCVINDIQRVKGNFAPDYVKAKNLFGYTAR